MVDSSVYQKRVGLREGRQEETLNLEGGSSLGLERTGQPLGVSASGIEGMLIVVEGGMTLVVVGEMKGRLLRGLLGTKNLETLEGVFG